MKNTIFLLLFFLCAASQINAQLADGDTAPNFILDDLQGNSWDLYDVLDQGYSVVLDFSATWCGPCWNYHQTGILEDLYDNYGPGGTDQVMVFMIEADPATSQPCIYGPSGCTGGSIGDWTAGVTYPILNPLPPEASAVNNDFNINYFPTLYGVAPNRKIYEVGQASSSEWENWLLESFQMVFSTATVEDSDCYTSNIDLLVNGGYGTVDFDWSNGSDEEDQTNVENDEYYVTLTDSNNFEFEIGPIEVDNQNIAEVVLVEAQDLLCNNDFTGYLEVEMDGGSGNFSYDWSNGDNTPVLDGLDGGDYEVVVTDLDSGCEFDFDYFIDEPDELIVEVEVENAECGSNGIGEVDFLVDGGTYPFTFTFEEFETTDDYVTIEAGEYDVTVTDGNGCETFVQFAIEVDEAPLAIAQAIGSFNCLADTVWVNADSSSIGNFIEYNWFDPTNNFVGSGFQVQVDSAGIYTLEVYDDELECSSYATIVVDFNMNMPEAVASTLNDIDCSNATAMISGTGSEDSLTIYQWTTLDGEILSDPALIDINVAAAGTYTLMVTDTMSGCVSMANTVVIETGTPIIDLAGDLDICPGFETQLCVTVGADESPEWFVDGNSEGSTNCITVEEGSNVTVILTNNVNGCSSDESMAITALDEPIVDLIGDLEFCENSNTELCVELEDEESAIWYIDGQNAGNSECITVMDNSDVTVVITNDISGCSGEETFTVEAQDEPIVELEGDLGFCENNSTELCVDLGVNESATWYVDGQNAGSSACINVNTSSAVEVEIENTLSGCTNITSFDVEANELPDISVETPEVLGCNNMTTTIDLNVSGPNVTINWYNGQQQLISTNEDVEVSEAGTYTVFVTNENGCETSLNVAVDADLNDVPSAAFIYQNADFDFSFSDESEGTVTERLWDFGDGTTSSEENPIHTYNTAGYYNVCLSSTNDCGTSTECKEVLAKTSMQLSSVIYNISCFDAADGSIAVSVFGGLPGFEYNWEDENGNVFTGNPVESLGPGTYTLVVSDATGEVLQESYSVVQPEEITVEANLEHTSGGLDNGIIELDIVGGNGGFSVLWDHGSTETSLSDLPAGDYHVVITDSKGCTKDETYTVESSTNVNEIDFVSAFNLHPNPASGFVTIDVEMDKAAQIELSIISLLGQENYKRNFSTNRLTERIDISSLTGGVYLVQLRSGEKVAIKKLVIAN